MTMADIKSFEELYKYILFTNPWQGLEYTSTSNSIFIIGKYVDPTGYVGNNGAWFVTSPILVMKGAVVKVCFTQTNNDTYIAKATGFDDDGTNKYTVIKNGNITPSTEITYTAPEKEYLVFSGRRDQAFSYIKISHGTTAEQVIKYIDKTTDVLDTPTGSGSGTYGKVYSADAVNAMIADIEGGGSTYILPAASDTQLGGIKLSGTTPPSEGNQTTTYGKVSLYQQKLYVEPASTSQAGALTPALYNTFNSKSEKIYATQIVGSMYRNNVAGDGTLSISGTSGQFPTVLDAGTYIVRTYMSSTTTSYSITETIGNNTFTVSTTNGIIEDQRTLALTANSTWSGSVTTVNSGTILDVKIYKEGVLVATVGMAAVSNDYEDLNNTPTFKTINNESILGSGNITIEGGGSSYTLPQATTTTLGGVKVGEVITGQAVEGLQYIKINGASGDNAGKIGYPMASASANGLMSIADKGKLDGLPSGVDDVPTARSSNLITSNAVYYAFENYLKNDAGSLIEYFVTSADPKGAIAHGTSALQVPTLEYLNSVINAKQNTLVSGTNIKTINNQSLLGSGNITISGGSGGEANVIEGVTLNGTAGTITNKIAALTETDPTVKSWAKNDIASGTPTIPSSSADIKLHFSTEFEVSEVYDQPYVSFKFLVPTFTSQSQYQGWVEHADQSTISKSLFTYDSLQYLLASKGYLTSVPAATDSVIGGFMTGYAESEDSTYHYYPVGLSSNKAFVKIAVASDSAIGVTKLYGGEDMNTHSEATDGAPTVKAMTDSLASKANLASPNFSGTPKISNVNIATVNDIPTIPDITKGTTTGSGNVVSDISVSGHTVTLTKGVTALTEVPLGDNSTIGGAMLANGNVGSGVSASEYAQGFGTTENHLCLASATASAAGAMSASDKVKVDKLPSITSSDAGKVLTINSSGNIVATTPSYIYSGSASPSSSTGNNGDIYIQS